MEHPLPNATLQEGALPERCPQCHVEKEQPPVPDTASTAGNVLLGTLEATQRDQNLLPGQHAECAREIWWGRGKSQDSTASPLHLCFSAFKFQESSLQVVMSHKMSHKNIFCILFISD